MGRLAEIAARKKEIRALLESNTEVNLDELEAELRSLEKEQEGLEKRAEILAKLNSGEIQGREIEKPDDKEKREEKEQRSGLPAEPKDHKRIRVYRNFGEQLAAIKRSAVTGNIDERQLRLENECRALGMNVGIGSEGGLAVQTDFAGTMMESAATAGNILPLVDRYDISDNSDSVGWVDIDETSVATTVFGGVQVYWAGEAASVTAKAPKLLEKELRLLRLMGVAYVTHELESHSNFVSDLYTRAFTKAINRELEACILTGTGVGKPLGVLVGGHTTTVSKETGQAADTILWENIVKMSNRALDKSKSVWVLHPDCMDQIDLLVFPTGVSGTPVYLSQLNGGNPTTLKGRPIVETDHCAALGDLGDINFVDFSEYMMIFKGGLQQDYSIHVQFLTAQNCFRFIFYANGMPKKNSALTIKNSSNTRSSCVKLQAR